MPNVNHLLNLWRNEGFNVTKIKEERAPDNPNQVWTIFQVYSPTTMYYDYGRHGVIRTLSDAVTGELIQHELFNISQRNGENPYDIQAIGQRKAIV